MLTIIDVPSIAIETVAGIAPILPDKVSVKNSANSLELAVVTAWDTIDESTYNQVGTFKVYGTVEDTELKIEAVITVTYAELPEIESFTYNLIQKILANMKPRVNNL